jgi:acyl-CoA synthetase (AMP-forming)/AMP-acid ligase II
MNIASIFLSAAEKYPDKIAIVESGREISFAELAASVKKTAGYFQSNGIRKGDRVMVFVPMSIDLYRIVLALFYCGATVVFLDEWVSKKRMEACCRQADCKAFIGIWKVHVLKWFSPVLRKIPIKLGVKYRSTVTAPVIADTAGDDTALITFTTGSTGSPKAAKRTHSYLKEQFLALEEIIKPQQDDVDMTSLPIVLLMNLGTGATSVIGNFKPSKPKKFRPENILRLIRAYGVNRMTASPYFVKSLSEYVLKHKGNTHSVRKIFTGGAAVFPAEAALMQKAFPSTEVNIVYGSTEAEPISIINAEELISNTEKFPKGCLPVGKPYRSIRIKIIPVTDGPVRVTGQSFETITTANQIGEIVVSGPHVLKEYYNSPEAFAQNKIVLGKEIWHRTGDAGCLDEQGELGLAGRCSQIIHYKGQPFYPFLFDKFCSEISGITASAVLQLDKDIIAVIETAKTADKEAIRSQIQNTAFPVTKIVFLEHIPRDPRHFSKVDYKKLEEKLPRN